jgi:hypothetical protein
MLKSKHEQERAGCTNKSRSTQTREVWIQLKMECNITHVFYILTLFLIVIFPNYH